MPSNFSCNLIRPTQRATLLISFMIIGLTPPVLAQESGNAARNSMLDPSNSVMDARTLASPLVSLLTISHDWFLTTMVPPSFVFGQAGTFSPNQFTFTASEPVMLSITDNFCKGDRFEVFDNGVSLGATSTPVNEFPGCSISTGPEDASANPDYSSGDFVLGPGFHHIRIKVVDSPWEQGRGFIEVHEAPEVFEYAAKIVCGPQRDPNDMRLARGYYTTAINVHNPHAKTALFSKKLALTYPPAEQRAGKIYHIAYDSLQYDEALAVDCIDIEKEVFPVNGFPKPYIKGFVVIQSPLSLDVVGVYSTATVDKQGRAAEHSGIHIEQIRERKTVPFIKPEPLPTPLSHFKCYDTKGGKRIDSLVTLSDQFGENSPTVLETRHFCNPVKKTRFDGPASPEVTPIEDNDHHLTFYNLDPNEVIQRRRVSIDNQFGKDQRFEITAPSFLAVPTRKLAPLLHPEPQGLDHFKCYKAIGDTVQALMDLEDQFGEKHQVQLGIPLSLCNPATKLHDSVTYPAENKDMHLMCYGIEIQLDLVHDVRIINQFGRDGFKATQASMLCVPSKKTLLQ